MKKIVGVTSCPSGVAHTYMSAEALILAGEKYGIDVKIETQGLSGIENELTQKDILEADYVILSNTIEIKGKERFKGKLVLEKPVNELISQANDIMYTIKEKY